MTCEFLAMTSRLACLMLDSPSLTLRLRSAHRTVTFRSLVGRNTYTPQSDSEHFVVGEVARSLFS
ncbi:unannotated protein [freshwater metagenome]|uniref:Unannotated protein n=1 Tax=freshwater metagenome TaxID=449393 RepID=A0A6J6DXL3_9ZZZZ